jgi:hypothetical protein
MKFVGRISLSAETLRIPFTIGRYENLPYGDVCRADIPIRRNFTYTIHPWQVCKPAL